MTHRLNEDAGGPFFEAVRVADLGEDQVAGAFAYSVRILAKGADRRAARRRRTRLRSGKILDRRNAFLIECQIYDRSELGVRVRLVGDIPPQSVIRLYEDHPERLRDVRIIWRKDSELGLCFIRRPGAGRIGRMDLACLRGRYYAIDR